jgi:hypothetical protein
VATNQKANTPRELDGANHRNEDLRQMPPIAKIIAASERMKPFATIRKKKSYFDSNPPLDA